MSILRLVGGTEYREAGPAVSAVAASKTPPGTAAVARKVIRKKVEAGKGKPTGGADTRKLDPEVSAQAKAVAASKSLADMAAFARTVIRQHVVADEGKTVEQLFDELNLDCERQEQLAEQREAAERYSVLWRKLLNEYSAASQRDFLLRRKLRAMGIQAAMTTGEEDLDVVYYGNVFDDLRLLKVIPALKPVRSVLQRLTF